MLRRITAASLRVALLIAAISGPVSAREVSESTWWKKRSVPEFDAAVAGAVAALLAGGALMITTRRGR